MPDDNMDEELPSHLGFQLSLSSLSSLVGRNLIPGVAVVLLLQASAVAQERIRIAPAPPTSTQTASPGTPAPLLDCPFESDEGGWAAIGQTGRVRIVHDPAEVKAGKGALALEYQVVPQEMNVLVRTVAEGSLKNMASLRFWLKTDAATPVTVVLSEGPPDAGNYGAMIWSPKNMWQLIELAPADFALNHGANDPLDKDGRLDLDHVTNIAILDAGQAFASIPENPFLPIRIDRPDGKRTLWLDELQALPAAPPKLSSVIDDFKAGFLKWVTLGGVQLSLKTSENPAGARAMEASYQAAGEMIVMLRPITNCDLRNTTSLELDIASLEPAQLVLSLETRKPGQINPSRWNARVELPGNRKLTHLSVAFSSFELDQNSASSDKLELGNVNSLNIADIGGVTSGMTKNTLWISSIRAQ